MNSLTKKDVTFNGLVGHVRNQCGLTWTQAEEVVYGLVNQVAEALISGRAVRIRGFGTFETAKRAPRQARNPKTGQVVNIPARRAVVFRPSSALKEALN